MHELLPSKTQSWLIPSLSPAPPQGVLPSLCVTPSDYADRSLVELPSTNSRQILDTLEVCDISCLCPHLRQHSHSQPSPASLAGR